MTEEQKSFFRQILDDCRKELEECNKELEVIAFRKGKALQNCLAARRILGE